MTPPVNLSIHSSPADYTPWKAVNHMTTNLIRNLTLENEGEDGENHKGDVEECRGHAAGL